MSVQKIIENWSIESSGSTRLSLPVGAEVLRIGYEGVGITLWVMSEVGQVFEERWFHVVGTGKEFQIGGSSRYVGSVWGRDMVHHVLIDHPQSRPILGTVRDEGCEGGITVWELRNRLRYFPDGYRVVVAEGDEFRDVVELVDEKIRIAGTGHGRYCSERLPRRWESHAKPFMAVIL